MEQKFYICEHCGNIIMKVKDAEVPVMCRVFEAQGNKNAEQYISALNSIYSRAPRANMLCNYIIFFIFTNYMRIHKEQSG